MRSFFMRGGRGTVFRVGTIAPDSRAGQFQRDIDSHFLSRYLRSTIELGIACDWQDRYFSLTPVDILARAILRFAIREDAVGQTFHLTNTQELSHGDLVKSLQSFGYRVQLLNSEEFENQLQILGTDQRKSEAVGRLLPLVERVPGKRVKIDKTWTDSWLEPLGISYPKFERDWFQKCLQNGICRGFFPPFP
jgi:thioester reductase-like protein